MLAEAENERSNQRNAATKVADRLKRSRTQLRLSSGTEVEATKRRTEITVETHRVLRISGNNAAATNWCDECGEQVWMVSPEQAALLGDVPTRRIYRWVENGHLHSIERPEALLVCVNSLKAIISTDLDGRRELQ